ncbi:MAG: TonB-dependent receptor plug domain-containing protein, partial [Bacteroidota bacterium]|nr:TonB-dependent receptor plug domain-containing protein [Bacteroidota bacterium]
MKCTLFIRSIFALTLLFASKTATAQYYVLGRGLDDNEVPYAYATAELRGEGIHKQQTCSELGVFRFEDLKAGSYELVYITSYGIRRKKIELKGSVDVTLHISRNIAIDEISVVAKRAGDDEPVTHQNISGESLKQKNTGQDLPYLLEGSPSLVVTSDAGHGIGYTGLRIRGSDPTRINVTLNGIPVNDAESHNVFWVDLPDIAASTTNVQIQRGIGWSQTGAGDLGGGIHINTLGFHYDPYLGVEFGGGSFNTKRISLSGGSGLIKGRYTFDARGSYITSDGFIDRAKSTLFSGYASMGYHHDLTNLRLIVALGDELTYQSWNGVPEQYVFSDDRRTFNTAGMEQGIDMPYDNEVDDYRQTYYQLHYDQAITPYAKWT